LDELIVDGMDAEQIWQQLEIQVGFSDPQISQ
jgi:U3 small nucleolar ribonucleoprotein component